MKKVTYMPGVPVHSDAVVSLKKKNIPDSEFKVPADYRRVQTLMELWMKHVETKKET